MKRLVKTTSAMCALVMIAAALPVIGQTQTTGSISFEQRYFFEDALYAQQTRAQASLAIAPQWYATPSDNTAFTFSPFARIDQRDSQRTHVDIRELMLAYYAESFEVRAGIGKVFWGQAESLHLVDIINQTDWVEAVDGEEKLGQAMLDVRYLSNYGTFSAYILPNFRERTFSGVDGRFRGALAVNTDRVEYESASGKSHLDYALRWQHSAGDLEWGLSYFDGTARLPQLQLLADGLDSEGNPLTSAILAPQYNLLEQTGLDMLYVAGDFLFKLEAISARERQERYFAAVMGFEYTNVNAFESGYDIGWLMEYQTDERDTHPMILGQNDLMLGARIAFNDFNGSQLLFGIVQDLDNSASRQAFIEGGRRLNQHWRLEVNGYFFTTDVMDDALFPMRRDDHINLALEYYF